MPDTPRTTDEQVPLVVEVQQLKLQLAQAITVSAETTLALMHLERANAVRHLRRLALECEDQGERAVLSDAASDLASGAHLPGKP